MAHVQRDRKKLLSRVRRIQGQLSALESALQEDDDCAAVLVQIAAVRGAVHGLMTEVLSAHLQEHVAGERDEKKRNQELAAVTALIRTYLK
ncbi:metal/formaldehyde-sensitive transcriptional repressor [Dokdonella sp.]|uniref:metal/formaldehyde-sensitive transcriptional repressor n=1 Tax=Dokdonella sp. TaxID=2291710 RepID=UPI001B0EE731|nr:metal/formaldehyde-sensitive transcriptional repressor [Dokdonella sp.]MBO9662905.1 metal/formaldehyde-sensitive transcriptional repressor [Dokdonella sp.]